MTTPERYAEEKEAREKFDANFDRAIDTIVEYGNFCIKLLVTLNSTALISSIAFLGSSNGKTTEAALLSNIMPDAIFLWAISLTLILLAAFFTYINHRWYPSILSVWHKENFLDLYVTMTRKEKISSFVYNTLVNLGIWSGVASLFFFLWAIWKIALAF